MVVDTGSSLKQAIPLDDMCRRQGVAYVRGEIRGVFGSVFCDFGENFTVLDPDGAHRSSDLQNVSFVYHTKKVC